MTVISIVVPVYNLGKYIEKTLDSIFAQTFTDIEVVAVNDGSNDNTSDVLEKYSRNEPRLKVVHQRNSGVSRARINGVIAATGEYIGFVDGDDLIDPDMYKRLFSNIIKYDADISHCGYRIVKNKSTEYFYDTGKLVLQSKNQGVCDLLEGSFIEPSLGNKLFRKSLFSDLTEGRSPFDDTLTVNEDLLLNYFLFRRSSKSVYEDFCPYVYMKRDGSVSQARNRIEFYDHPYRVRLSIMKDSIGTEWEETSRISFVSKSLNIISMISDKASEEYDCLRDELIDSVKDNSCVAGKLPLKQKTNYYLLMFSPKVHRLVNYIYRKF